MENELQKNEALNDYMSSSVESLKHLKKDRKRKVIIIFFAIIFIIIFIFNGPLRIVPQKQSRYYEVKLNNQELSVNANIFNTAIIPGVFEIPNGNSESFPLKYYNQNIIIPGKSFMLNIKSYTCFLQGDNKSIPISCNKKTRHQYENFDSSYTSMQILQYNYDDKYTYSLNNDSLSRTYYIEKDHAITSRYEEYSIIYDGTYSNDLTSYIAKESVYLIKVNIQYQGTKGMISFGVVNDGQNILAI